MTITAYSLVVVLEGSGQQEMGLWEKWWRLTLSDFTRLLVPTWMLVLDIW
jgi:hypothetical protein